MALPLHPMSRILRTAPALTLLLFSNGVKSQDFVLGTPGTATWETVAVPGGSQTVFTITGDTILDWNQMVLRPGNQLIFNFLGGDTVTNQLSGSGTHLIAGDVSGNGNLGFFAPNGNLVVTGSVTGNSAQ